MAVTSAAGLVALLPQAIALRVRRGPWRCSVAAVQRLRRSPWLVE